MRTLEQIFAENLREIRSGRTQAEMAEFLEMPLRSYVNLESGRVTPQQETRTVISAKLGISEGRLFADPDYVATPEEALKILEKALKESELTPEMKRIVGRLRRLESFQLEALERVLDGVIKTLPPDPGKKGK